jgi:hypothetical protein
MVKDEELVELSHPEFWDNRYASESSEQATINSFEWFRDFSKLRFFFAKHLPAPPSEDLVLHLGCGNSVFPLSVVLSNVGKVTCNKAGRLIDL